LSLNALLLNCTLKKSPEPSNTEALMDRVIEVLETLDTDCEKVRVVDHDVAFGVTDEAHDKPVELAVSQTHGDGIAGLRPHSCRSLTASASVVTAKPVDS